MWTLIIMIYSLNIDTEPHVKVEQITNIINEQSCYKTAEKFTSYDVKASCVQMGKTK
jgi:hypothetical protein